MPDLFHLASGDGEIRTLDPLLARQVLSQLSYTPTYNKDFLNHISLSDVCAKRGRIYDFFFSHECASLKI